VTSVVFTGDLLGLNLYFILLVFNKSPTKTNLLQFTKMMNLLTNYVFMEQNIQRG
jgi:hypothetical protein